MYNLLDQDQDHNQSNAPTHQELIHWIRLAKTKNIGAKRLRLLINKYNSAEKAIYQIERGYDKFFYSFKNHIVSTLEATDELSQLTDLGGRIMTYKDELFPQNLLETNDYPAIISMLGNIKLLQHTNNALAIVGSRNASFNSCKFTENIARDLSNHNILIVSGLAKGIDLHAHIGANYHNTIAVIATGLDEIYPHQHRNHQKKIAEEGLLISEYFLGMKPHARNFPYRNRIVAGLTKGVLVIEAMKNSGSLITTRYALEYNRDIYAVPGSPLEPRSEGTNNLIKQGAKMVTQASDITENFTLCNSNPINISQRAISKFEEHNAEEHKDDTENPLQKQSIDYQILSLLTDQPILIDEIAKILIIDISTLRKALLKLELKNKVKVLIGDLVEKIV